MRIAYVLKIHSKLTFSNRVGGWREFGGHSLRARDFTYKLSVHPELHPVKYITSVSHDRESRFQEVKGSAGGHRAGKWQNQGLHPRLSDSKLKVLSIYQVLKSGLNYLILIQETVRQAIQQGFP